MGGSGGGQEQDVVPEPGPAEDDVPGAPARRPPALARFVALSALVVPQALVLLVQGPAPLLLRSAPLLLLALHPFAPWNVLVSARTDAAAFVAVYVAVRALPCCGDYFVGRWYGTKVLERLASRRRIGPVTRLVQRLSRRVGGLLLVVYPGVTSSVLAGSNALPWRRFFPLMLLGVCLAALYVRALASAASGVVDRAASFVEEHAVPLAVVLTLGVVVARLQPWRRWSRSG